MDEKEVVETVQQEDNKINLSVAVGLFESLSEEMQDAILALMKSMLSNRE